MDRRSARHSIVLLLLAPVLAWGNPTATSPGSTRGAELLAPLKRDLMGALKAGLAQGPVEAIVSCHEQAPAIAASLARDGVRVGRSSHRLRNPANATPAWVAPVLSAYLADPTDRAPRTLRIAADREGYVEAIVTGPLCLTCHGGTLAPELEARIAELYPEDRATGFALGELRGVFWVEYPIADESAD